MSCRTCAELQARLDRLAAANRALSRGLSVTQRQLDALTGARRPNHGRPVAIVSGITADPAHRHDPANPVACARRSRPTVVIRELLATIPRATAPEIAAELDLPEKEVAGAICTLVRAGVLRSERTRGTNHHAYSLRPDRPDGGATPGLAVTIDRVCDRLRQHPGESISELAKATGLNQALIGRAIRDLERERRLVRSKRHGGNAVSNHLIERDIA